MESTLEQIREQQKATWNQFAPGWGKWDNWVMNFLKRSGDEIIKQLELKDSYHVLDVATGTGEPGLTIASLVKNGKVTGQDLSDNMLSFAKQHARTKGIKNYETVSCDISNLPFPDNSFDAISCRMGFMFFPDMEKASAEIYRVLRPGGRFATAVWGPADKNFWITSIMGPISKNLKLDPPVPGAPGMFRCSNAVQMLELFKKAGFKNAKSEEIIDEGEVESVELYWEYMNDVAAPVVAALKNASPETVEKIRNEVFDGLKKTSKDKGKLRLDYSALIFHATK
jgi:ubiquinone/menaquinone biosynthesis C-methylase UbiE